MYCRSCGKMLADNSTICINCGVPVGRGKRFCPVCGEATADGAVFCVKCGAGFAPPQPAVPKDAKSRLLAGLFGIF